MGEGAVGLFCFFQYPPPIAAPEIFSKNIMIKDILQRAKSTISQPSSQPKPTASTEPAAAPSEPVPQPTPEASLKPASPRDARELAVMSAKQAGYSAGNEVTGAICRHQPARHPKMLFVMVPDWHDAVLCWVKDAKSWLPVNPPYDRLKCRWTGMADVEGRLIFESADECKKSRLIRRK